MRRKDRDVTNMEESMCIVKKAKYLHLGMLSGEYPHIIPMHYGFACREDRFIFYMHCAKEGEKLDLLRANPNVCVEIETDVELLPGGDIPCKYGSTFASFLGKGYAEIIDDTEEKIKGLHLLMQQQTGRDFEITPKMADMVAVIRVEISSFTAKRRQA